MSKYNRGITVSVGYIQSGTQRYIDIVTESYQPHWQTVTESFEKYDYSTVSIFKGNKFSASVTTGLLTKSEMVALRNALLVNNFTFKCPEFTSGVSVQTSSISFPTAADNYGTEYYQMSFDVAAVALTNSGGL